MNKKNVLMVHNFYQIGGGEHTVFHNEVELLEKNGHKVITYTRDNKELSSLFKILLLPFTTIWSFRTYRDIKRIIKKENIDIVHCHNTFPLISPSVYYAARKMNVPVIQTIHNFRFLCPKALFYRDGKICEDCLKNNNFKPAFKHKCYRDSKIQTLVVSNMLNVHRKLKTYKKINYIFLTEFNKDKFNKLIGEDYPYAFIKPNFVHNKFNLERPKELNNTFVFMGRLDENKGIKFLVDSWKDINDIELHIYGEGSCQEYVNRVAKINNNIKYMGYCNQKEIFEDLVKSYGMIIPSECYEGFPMSIAESFSFGVPVLSSNIGNHASIVGESGAGCLYELDNEDSLKNGISEMIAMNDSYSEKAKKYFDEFISSEKNYKELMDIYDKARVIK